jgi:adenylate cyclase class 2
VSVETEIKLRVRSAAEAVQLLRGVGFEPAHERAFEANTLFDTADKSLLAKRHLLRLREFRGESILTFKGVPAEGPHKIRPEFETAVASSAAFRQILESLGYAPCFRYEKYRTTFQHPGENGHAVVDETPIGVFLELEGEAGWIDRTASRLGFGPGDYITASYGALWRSYCLERGIEPGDMVFAGRACGS